MPLPSGDDTIYLDHAATTPVDPAVTAAMLPFFTEHFGNPSSIYRLGQDARAALDRARGTVARILGCGTSEIIFNSGATEGDNLALIGVAWHRRLANPDRPMPHLITTEIEHHAVLHTAQWLERQGFAVTYVGCDAAGVISPEEVEAAIRPETCLISVMYANNETGAIQPVANIGAIARRHGILFHTDAVQAAGSLPLNVDTLNVDLLSLSAHKFYGPKGVGMLYVRGGTPIAFQQHGGGQESGRRGGTENVAGIVGMAVALDRAEARREQYNQHCANLRDRLWHGIQQEMPDIQLNGPSDFTYRLPNNLNISIPGVQGETMLLSLDMEGIAASAGSACTTGNSEPSHVLRAMGLSDERCRASLRLTVGLGNTVDEMDETVDALATTVERVRELAGIAS
ncbi:MAG TPA: cysteine desulfurase family protein [Thermomicrobiales bacterium]|nr:cysteine desulfurase family protein [Thermomicrobiales bacterium]